MPRKRPLPTSAVVDRWPPPAGSAYALLERHLFGTHGLRIAGADTPRPHIVASWAGKEIATIDGTEQGLVVRTTAPKPFRATALDAGGLTDGVRTALRNTAPGGTAVVAALNDDDVRAVAELIRLKIAYAGR